MSPTLGPCLCVPVRLSLLPVLSSGTCSNSFAHVTLPGHAGTPGNPGGRPGAGEAVGVWAVQNRRRQDDGPVR